MTVLCPVTPVALSLSPRSLSRSTQSLSRRSLSLSLLLSLLLFSVTVDVVAVSNLSTVVMKRSRSDRADEIKCKHVDLIKNPIVGAWEHVVATESRIEERKNLLSKASSSTRKWKYDLIFSFSGKDAPQDFLRDLESRLTENGIISFKVDNELQSGEEIGAAFLEAIESSMIALVILSEEYASSKWCLDELLKILEGRKNRAQKIMPILYNVDPSDLENPTTGAFANAFAGHEKNFKEEVETWKDAMTQVVDLRVYPLENWSSSDGADAIKSKHVNFIKNSILGAREHVLATESRIEEMKNFLSKASSSSTREWKYEVFFSFRGADTRHGFLFDLHKRFAENGIKCYKDHIHLKIGEEIEPAIMEAIEASMVALIIISEDYASSRWCLDELWKAMECKEKYGQIVIPIFFNVVPSDVRRLTSGSFGNAFAGHHNNFKDKEESWKVAMTRVAKLAGWFLESPTYRSDSKDIDDIMKGILERLNNINLEERNYPLFPWHKSIMASSSTRKWKYDLIFSFSGEDAQDFLCDLDSRLTENGIITFKVDNELRSGEEIGAAFLEAIESSMIAVVILSEKYVSSKWCLDELLKILKCKKNRGQEVIPILYHVVPSDLENPTTGAFANAFAGHEKNFKEEVETWTDAMTQVVGLRNYPIENWSRFDRADEVKSKHVDLIKNAILGTRKLLVATESRIEEMKNLLSKASSSSTRKWKYEVFFSFRGADIRHGFLSHLYQSFAANGIKCFKDDIHLRRGQEIEPAIMEAIEASMIALIIVSKDYASSTWCLDELLKAMEFKEKNGQIVIPIFYDVNPSDIRPTSGSFANAFAGHHNNFEDKGESWKAAMTGVANLVGWFLESDRSESEYINDIMDDILDKLKKKTLV